MTKRTNPRMLEYMANHYSQPKGFVGRNICYLIKDGWNYHGGIVGGSATMHLAGRETLIPSNIPLENIVNNIFYHVLKIDGKYPCRNFTIEVLSLFRETIIKDWLDRYGDKVLAFESLVELPRTGEIYKRDGWQEVGLTKGFTCKRIGGYGTDNWSGQRVWDIENLRPKRVFCRMV